MPKRLYAKAMRSKCPRCLLSNTVATSTVTAGKDCWQYRVCRSPICRHRYKIAKVVNDQLLEEK